jgi:FkbM family methyltransferase
MSIARVLSDAVVARTRTSCFGVRERESHSPTLSLAILWCVDALSVARAIRTAPILRRADPIWDAVRPVFDRCLRLAYGRRGIVARVAGGETLLLDPACRTFTWVPDNAETEDDFWKAVMGSIVPGDTFADVGANIGVYSISAARRGALVTSFEPNPDIAALLRRNVDLNGVSEHVSVREVAVAARPGELHLLPVGAHGCAGRIDELGEITVKAVQLTEHYDLLKIDVEGYELEVLRGADALLGDPAKRPRAIFLELHPLRLEADFAASLRTLLPRYVLTRLGTRSREEHWLARAAG